MLTESQANLLGWFRRHAASQLAEGRGSRAAKVILGALATGRRLIDPESGEAEMLLTLICEAGSILQQSGRPEEAIPLLEEAIGLIEASEGAGPPQVLAEARQHLGMAFDQIGEETRAAAEFHAALEILESLEPPPLEAIAHLANNLGMVHRHNSEFEEASRLYEKAQAIFEALGESHALDLATVCNNRGSLHWAWSQPDLARQFHLQALKLRREHLPATHPDIGQTATNLAAVYHDIGDHDRAGRNYQRALRILRHNLKAHRDTYEIAASNYADLLELTSKPGKAQRLRQQTERHLAKAEKKKKT